VPAAAAKTRVDGVHRMKLPAHAPRRKVHRELPAGSCLGSCAC
jgi:hypothetical protein